MKRFLSLFLTLILLLSFTGCDNKPNVTASENNELIVSGIFLTFDNAYEKGYLSAEDVKHVSYYMQGSVIDIYGNTVDFSPQNKLTPLSKETRNCFEQAYFDNCKEYFLSEKIDVSDIEVVDFYGIYNNSYVLMFKVEGLDSHTSIKTYHVANIAFVDGGDSTFLRVFVKNS